MLKRRDLVLGLLTGSIAIAYGVAQRGDARSAAKRDPHPKAVDATNPASLLQKATSWAYQLQNYDFRELAASDADILVVDYSISGDDRNRFTGDVVRLLQKKADGSRRLVLAYVSIGEAEAYRFYWKPEWIETVPTAPPFAPTPAPSPAATGGPHTEPMTPGRHATPALPATDDPATTRPERRLSALAPAWLGSENESWSGNFFVRYEDPQWQSIFIDGPQSYLSRVINAGFDGVYLDRIDAFYEHPDHRPDAAQQMLEFVTRIAQQARAAKPDFLIVPQNGEELLSRRGYAEMIDAIAKEDLLFGSPDHGMANTTEQIANTLRWLSMAKRKGRRVLVVEYLDDPETVVGARAKIAQMGFIPSFAPRGLDQLSPLAVPQHGEPLR